MKNLKFISIKIIKDVLKKNYPCFLTFQQETEKLKEQDLLNSLLTESQENPTENLEVHIDHLVIDNNDLKVQSIHSSLPYKQVFLIFTLYYNVDNYIFYVTDN